MLKILHSRLSSRAFQPCLLVGFRRLWYALTPITTKQFQQRCTKTTKQKTNAVNLPSLQHFNSSNISTFPTFHNVHHFNNDNISASPTFPHFQHFNIVTFQPFQHFIISSFLIYSTSQHCHHWQHCNISSCSTTPALPRLFLLCLYNFYICNV